jgi:hypothetical protein
MPGRKRRIEPMPRYPVERTVAGGLPIPINDAGVTQVPVLDRPTLGSPPTRLLASRIAGRRVVIHTSVLAGGLLAAALTAVLIGPASPAAARQVDPPPPNTGYTKCAVDVPSVSPPALAPASPPMGPFPPVVVCTLEVAVPTPIVVADRQTEMLHLSVAAVLGATLAAAATATRRRRRPTAPVRGLLGDADRSIDITDTVQSVPRDGPRGDRSDLGRSAGRLGSW